MPREIKMSKKRIISAICILLAAVMIIMGAGKTTRDSKKCAENFIEDFYTITDYETYSFARQNPYSNEFTAQRLARENYGEYFTEDGLEEFISDNIQAIFEEMVYSGNCTSVLEKLSLTLNEELSSGRNYAYDYDAAVDVVDPEGNSDRVRQHGTIIVNTRDMKISSFKVMDSMSVIKAVSSMY